MGQTEQSESYRNYCPELHSVLVYLHLNGWLGIQWYFDLQPLPLKVPAQQPRAQTSCSGTTTPAQPRWCTPHVQAVRSIPGFAPCHVAAESHGETPKPLQVPCTSSLSPTKGTSLAQPPFVAPRDLLPPFPPWRGPGPDLPLFLASGLSCASAAHGRMESVYLGTLPASVPVQARWGRGTK